MLPYALVDLNIAERTPALISWKLFLLFRICRLYHLIRSKKQVTPVDSTAREVQNEWSCYGFSSIDSKVRNIEGINKTNNFHPSKDAQL